jgi:DNA-binding XRE family transcriptional regulator
MENNAAILWDTRITPDEVKRILENEQHPRFIEIAALLLSRMNRPREVFETYLDRRRFVQNWAKIKSRMRVNRWNDTRIIFWDEVCKVVRETKGLSAREPHKRPLRVDADFKALCDQIRLVRQQRGLTQKQLSKVSGISQQSISFIEQGYINVTLGSLKKITDALGLKLVLKTP